jgi:hypothetical protein
MKILSYSLSKLEIDIPIHEKQNKKITKLQITKHNMNQFINRNNVYGYVHTITKSLIIPSGSMA